MKPEEIIRLGFSTCPNDTFMFGALVGGWTVFRPEYLDIGLHDIDQLNDLVNNNDLHIGKISLAAYPYVSANYELLNSGGALGYRNGPLLVSRRRIYPDEIPDLHIGIPGYRTTANLLLDILVPGVTNKSVYLFSDIEAAVMDDECDAGLLIHEKRFTYSKLGLQLITDLGEVWEKKYNLPVPLGGIAVKRSLPIILKKSFEIALSESIELAWKDRSRIWPFIRKHAQSMDDEVINSHIDLYVNEFSINLGNIGREAIRVLFEESEKMKLTPGITSDIFLD